MTITKMSAFCSPVVFVLQGITAPDPEYDFLDDVFFDSPPVSPASSPFPPSSPSATFFDAPSSLRPIAERSKRSEGNCLFYNSILCEVFLVLNYCRSTMVTIGFFDQI